MLCYLLCMLKEVTKLTIGQSNWPKAASNASTVLIGLLYNGQKISIISRAVLGPPQCVLGPQKSPCTPNRTSIGSVLGQCSRVTDKYTTLLDHQSQLANCVRGAFDAALTIGIRAYDEILNLAEQ